ncbi:MAG: hypothetical protein BMS9Abin23_0196 [Thermodesulfobacteriota bacterium]|nr:MAG: hypothetical protein BMS9Abin23_0196 [Thermodesulfobacteriota bacterium]
MAGENPFVLLAGILKERGMTLATAESCTGGLLSSLITDVAGSSDYFSGGVIAYSNEVKKNLLNVSDETLERYGAVSRQTAGEMAEGVRKRLKSSAAVAITGIAGPAGGTARKPVGTVYIAVITGRGKSQKIIVKKFLFKGKRLEVKKKSAREAVLMLLEALGA